MVCPQPSTLVARTPFTKLGSEKITNNDVSAAAAALARAASKRGAVIGGNPFTGHHDSTSQLHAAAASKHTGGDAPVAPLSSFTGSRSTGEGSDSFTTTLNVLARPKSRHGQLLPLQQGADDAGSSNQAPSGVTASSQPAQAAKPAAPQPAGKPAGSLFGALAGKAASGATPAQASPTKKKRGPNPMLRAVNRRSANPETDASRRKARAQLQVGTLMKIHSAKSILMRRLRARQQARRAAGGSAKSLPGKAAGAAAAFGGATGSSGSLLGKLAASAAAPAKPEPEASKSGNDDDDDGPSSCQDKLLWVCSVPYIYLFKLTVPDCREKRWEKWYMATFGMSIFWIGVLSFLMVCVAWLWLQRELCPC